MNTFMLVNSFRYVCNNFDLLVSISPWIYQELSIINYDDDKLYSSLKNDFEVAESIIHLNEDKNVLDSLLFYTYSWRIIFDSEVDTYRRLKLLLEAGADVHTANDETLVGACEFGNIQEVTLLLEYGADVYEQNNRPLRSAVETGCIEVVRLLLETGADARTCIDYTEPDGYNYFDHEIAELLLEYIK